MGLKESSGQVSHSHVQNSENTLKDYTSRTASIPNWRPDIDPYIEYENVHELIEWIPAPYDEMICSGEFIQLARNALSYAQEQMGIPTEEARRNTCADYAEEYISNTFYLCGYYGGLALSLLIHTDVPFELNNHWSSVEKALFEAGIHRHGKRFLSIQQDFLPHKPMTQLVQFYYQWKRKELYKGIHLSRSKIIRRVSQRALLRRSKRRIKENQRLAKN
ncbi:arginine-glutamic acid dipeptide repeats protein-like [Diachasmimorpha longicaudata]|uniref:arginine-glutamic acid dipeptide repeats protein-like n=1 Tax=Diachasmimorpha longicaudata TaxID=58733 RepID=UPI0030B919CB